MRPLDGITVIALEHAVAAPFATRQLADLGARVIKIERPNVGDFAREYDETVKGMSSHFVWLNRSKESLTLDLKHSGGAQILELLLERADAPARTGPDHATIVPYGRYQTGDGRSIMLGLQNEPEWEVFCEKVLLQPELAQDQRYDANSKRAARRSEINALIGKVFATLTTEELIERLDGSGIAYARMNTPDEVWEHPQLKARDRWREMDSPVGSLATLLPPVMMPDFEARIDAVPALGEHTKRILSELGYSSEDIVALREAGVV